MTFPTSETPPIRPAETKAIRLHPLRWLMTLIGLTGLLMGCRGAMALFEQRFRDRSPQLTAHLSLNLGNQPAITHYRQEVSGQAVEILADALPSGRFVRDIEKVIFDSIAFSAEICLEDSCLSQISMALPSEIVADATPLPTWLSNLELSAEQTHQVMVIDEMLSQELAAILTSEQYAQLQDSFVEDSDEPLSIYELNLGLSTYQQNAVNVAFEAAMQMLLSVLSDEQRRQFFQDLREEQREPDSKLNGFVCFDITRNCPQDRTMYRLLSSLQWHDL
ncbi:MAG: hypothetical protein AAFV72_10565 [Cyanobacteria bacterium J06635_1]